MKEIKAIIFDMDGVIFDTERVYLDIWSKVFEKYGYKITKEIYISSPRKNAAAIFTKLSPLEPMKYALKRTTAAMC